MCKEVAEETQRELTQQITSVDDFLKELLLTPNEELHKAFIERVKFLKGQHESLE